MKKSITIIAALLVVSIQTIKAQDNIELNNGKKINVKIIQQNSEGLKCILWNNPNSDTITINESEIVMMRHNGVHEDILLNIGHLHYSSDTVHINHTSDNGNLYHKSNDSITQRKINQESYHLSASNPDRSHISFGYGLFIIANPNVDGGIFSSTSPNSITGPVFIKYEYSISDYIGFGINFAYGQYIYDNTFDSYSGMSTIKSSYNTQYTTYSILGHFNFHFLSRFVNTRFDPFYGVGMGYKSVSTTVLSNDSTFQMYNQNISNKGSLGFETTFGLRYYVSNSIALYGEFGIAKSWLQFGATFKF